MGIDSTGYKVMYLIHILAAIYGFGPTFVYAAMASLGRKQGPADALVLSRASLAMAKRTTIGIYATGFFGFGVAGMSDDVYKMSQTWLVIAIVLFAVGLAVSLGLHSPNLKKLLALQESMAAGQGGPDTVDEIQKRGKQAGMFGGILHLLFALILLDMVFKPGFG